jgi:hypothetical protein
MPNKHFVYACLFLFGWANVALPFDRFVNYTSTLSVYDFASDKDVLWVGTSGGLYRFTSGTGTLYSDAVQFPDPTITSLCVDQNHTLWIGTANGYLYKRPQQGRQAVISSYFTAGWGITDVVLYGRYLIVGSDRGCSVFDTARLVAVRNATGFGTAFTTPKVNAVAVFRDTLLLGCDEGVAKLCLAGCDSGRSIENLNFYDQSIWTADSANRFTVKALVVLQDGWRALSTPGALFNGHVITTNIPATVNDTGALLSDSTWIMSLPSVVTAIALPDGGGLCIGTMHDYFYLWHGEAGGAINIPIDGPVFTTAQRVFVDREGLTWVCPSIVSGNYWWEGISVFRNARWDLYTPAKYSATMGWIYGGKDFRGVAEDRLGQMWFGTPGGSVKRYDRRTDSIVQYAIGVLNLCQGQFFQGPCSENPWAKSDAIACDSTGFLWIAAFENSAGSLICCDPRFEPIPDTTLPPATRHYRYFFPDGDFNHSFNIGCLCVDAANNIIAGDGYLGNGNIRILSHGGQPLQNGVTVVANFSINGGEVYDAAATQGTCTYIAASTGFYTYDRRSTTLTYGLCVNPSAPDTLQGVRAVEMEDDRILWLGTVDSGLIRYDLSNSTKTVINETQGLLSNHVWDLSLDRKNGYLWIASERGVSRYALGYSVGRPNIGAAFVYPNPFSKRRHVEMVFEKLPSSSTVLVYTISGALVATLPPAVNSAYGSTCVWRPPAAIVPGIYLYTVRSSAKDSRGKIIVTP